MTAWVMLFVMILPVSFVSAAGERGSEKNVDNSEVKVCSKYDDGYADTLRKEGKTYVFTKKTAGKRIPVKIQEDGIMIYCFTSEKIKLFDEKNKLVEGRMDEEGLGVDYVRYEENSQSTRRYSMPIRMVSVKKNEVYFLQIPESVPEEGYEVYAYLRPKFVKNLQNGNVYMSEGTGKYVFYPFTLKKKSLAGLYIDGVFISYGGGDTMYFKVQKKVAGKWKDVTPVRSKLASLGQCGKTAPYGLSKGTYRFGIKIKKGQVAFIDVDIRSVKCNSSTKKDKASVVKKGKYKEGIFTWTDNKAHWYKIQKSSKKNVKRLTVYAGGAAGKVKFSIYKEGKVKPLKTIKIEGKNRIRDFVQYTSRNYILKDNGTYYIKVTKANKKTNGAYKIGVK